VRFLDLRELWLFPSEPALGFCHCHSLPRPGADKICFELGNYAQDIEQQLPYWIVRVVDAAAKVERNPFVGELVRDIPGVGQRPSRAIKLGHYNGVTVAAGGERFAKAGPFALCTAKSVIDVDEVWTYAGGRESWAVTRLGKPAG
jgi:hypothetical protein